MSLVLDAGAGTGIAGATGVRPFLPPLLVGALARGDHGITFRHTSFAFLQSPAFLAAVFALAVISYAIERRGGASVALERILALVALALGALLFAGALAHADADWWPGLPAGAMCAAAGYLAVAVLFARARRRVEGSAAGLIELYAEGIALALAGVSIALPPVGFAAFAAFLVLLARGRSRSGQKYEGLRILR